MTEELKVYYALDAISHNENGCLALEILSIITYFAPENIHTEILSSLVSDEKELAAAVELLKKYSIVYFGQDKTIINIYRTARKIMITMIGKEQRELHVLEKALALLFMQGIKSNNLDHAMSAWGYVSAHPELVERFSGLPSYILNELNKQVRYKEGNKFGWKALDLLDKTIGKSHPGTLILRHNMGLLLGMEGKHKKALEILVPLYEQNVEHSGRREIRDTLISIARQLGELSRFDEAIKIYEQSLFCNQKVSDSSDDQMLSAWHDYAHILCDTGKYYEASQILKKILKRRSEIFDTKDGDTLSLESSLAHILVKESKYSEALIIFDQVFDKRKAIFGENHVITLRSRRDIALIFQHQGKLDQALAIYEGVTEKFKQVLGIDHPETLAIQAIMATVFQQRGDYQKALETYKYIYKKQSETLGEKHTDPLGVKYHIATILFIQEKHDEALITLQEVYRAYIEVFGPDHPKTVDLKTTLETLESVKLETIYSAAWEGDLRKVRSMIQSGIDINNTDFHKKTPLHYAAEHGHTSVVKLLLEKGAVYNGECVGGKTPFQITRNSEIKNLFNLVGKLIKDAKEGNHEQVSRHIAKEKVIVNAKDNGGSNAVHWAAYNGHKDIVEFLLESGADASQVTNKGNTPLHIATSKDHRDIIEVLLQHISRNHVNNFINAKTTIGGVTSMHVAAKNGFVEIVKSLLKHGAIYNIKNKESKTACELSKDQNITNLLKLCDELFQDAKNGNSEIISKLKQTERDEFIALTSARNDEGNTLLQVTITNKHENIAGKILEMVKQSYQTKLWSSSKFSLEQLNNLKGAAEVHLRFSQIYLPKLRSMSQSYDSEKNPSPWITLKEGSYYLGNADQLVKIYKEYIQGSIDNKNIKAVNAVLVELQFDSNHISEGYTDEAYGGQVECFVSKGQGTKYYKLLHSELKKDVRLFVEMVERSIDVRVTRFLESLKSKLKSSVTEELFKAIENNNSLEVMDCIRGGIDVNLKNTDGGTPLHYAVNNGDISIITSLLKNGADVTQVTAKGNTPLHIATSKGDKGIIEVLLHHTSRDKLNDLINARTTIGGTTSLHVAAKNGSVDIVKFLLKHGAIYNMKNKEGKTPLDFSTNRDITNLLKLNCELFQDAKIGNPRIFTKLQHVEIDEFDALKNARNDQGNTLLQVAVCNNHKTIASKFSEILQQPDQIRSWSIPELTLNQIEKLKKAAELHIECSSIFLDFVGRNCSQENSSEEKIEDVFYSWRIVKEGSYHLGNAFRLVELYKEFMNGFIVDENIQAINDMLVELQFDLKYNTAGYTDEAYNGKAECFVSKGQGTKYYELLHSKLTKDVRLCTEMIKQHIDVPVERFLESIKQRFHSIISEKLFKAIENNNHTEVEDCIGERAVVNLKNADGVTPLHYAVNNGNKRIMNILLRNKVDATLVTTKGNTPLHIAASKGHKEIVDVLLEHARRNGLNDLVNAQTTVGYTASLHAAAKNGFLDVVTSLLKSGAIYNIKNNEGKTPLDLSQDLNVINLLKLITELFEDATNGNFEMIKKLPHVESDEFIVFTNAHNHDGDTLLQLAMNNKYKNISSKCAGLFGKPDQIQSCPSPKCKLEQFTILQEVAELHINVSQLYLLKLRSILSQSCDSEKNPDPWVTLADGVSYLEDTQRLVEIYKWCTNTSSSIDNEDMQTVNDMLLALRFAPESAIANANKPHSEQIVRFISEGQGMKFYELVHSRLKKDVRLFIELVERNIQVPVKKFLESIKQKLQYVLPEKFFDAIENNNHLEVEDRIRHGVIVDSKNTDGRTPLHYAVNNGNLHIVNILLENGADATQVTNEGNTPLHIAISKDRKEIVDVLLQHVSHDNLNDFINAQTVGGTTSLHVAAENGSIDIVKSLLKFGAIYNIKNKESKTAFELSKDQNITNLLKLCDELFQDAKNGNSEIISKLKQTERDEFIALTSARNDEGNTLLQVAITNKHGNIAREILEIIKKPHRTKLWSSSEFSLEQLDNLKDAAEVHLGLSPIYLSKLRNVAQLRDSERSLLPWSTLKEGSYYLGNADHLVKIYKEYVHGSIDDKNIKIVNAVLIELQFDANHISTGYTDEAYGGQVKCFVSEGQGTKYYELLHSKLPKDVGLFLEMVEQHIDVPVERFLESIKQKLQYFEKFFQAIENNNHLEVEDRIRHGVIVNSKDTDGRTPLHYAVSNGNLHIINILLKNGADATQVSAEGNTPLHIATSKDLKKIAEVLLQHVSHDKLNDFVNAQTVGGTTSLHIAAQNGSWDLVKSLLKHGAIYNMKNKEGKAPLDFSKHWNITNLLKLSCELFQDAKIGNPEIISKLQHMELDEIIALKNARDDQGNTLLQVIARNNHKTIASKFSEILRKPDQIRSWSTPELTLNQIEKLKEAAQLYIQCSELFLPMLRNTSQSNRSEKNSFPWATLKAGSYYLQNVHSLVEVYKGCTLGSIHDRHIQAVNDILIELEFDPKHITLGYTDEAFDGKVECFVSKGHGTKYYELLHGEFKKDVRLFIKIVEPNIDINVKTFLKSMKLKLQSILSKMLFEAIKNNNNLAVRDCLREELVVNFKSADERTPLHYAVNNGNISIINTLLKYGAEVSQVDNKGETPLHIASAQGHKQIVEVLLQNVRYDKLNDFINAQTVEGNTSLQIAAKNSCLEVVEFLLEHGAIYNIKNQEGETALDLSNDQNVTNLLKLIASLFDGAKSGNFKIIRKLKAQSTKFTAVTNTRNHRGESLLQVAIFNKHQSLARQIEMIVKTRSNSAGH